jgi:carbamate kinase
VEAVIDKDLAGERLAEVVDADTFLVLTDVEKARLNFGKPDEKGIDRMTISEAEKYLEEGHFLPGSMGPKVKACTRFLRWGGKKAIITSLDKAVEGLDGRTGTQIYPDHITVHEPTVHVTEESLRPRASRNAAST